MAQKTIDQIATDHPVTSVDGTELFLVSKSGITSGGALTVIKDWILSLIPSASALTAGLMSSAHFTKVNTLATVASSGSYSDLSGTPANATTSVAGLMSSADKTKLDGVATGANNYVLPTATELVIGGVLQGEAVADVAGSGDVENKINELLATLRTAGIIAT